ncbi:site-specific integrase [Ralstonia insidiosa]|jgi:site-specific recombinase XerC|uniref:Recombinase XerD n=1 Tax=Ralstonia insidiosa TaxID=190721 RepID=A0A192A7Q1_9RALS|nr:MULTISPECIES: site-specific integrase [Ralstonia]KMW47667.1 site-specific recombinase XerD [Ralstonia sp. MD27]ANJ76409.1 recombinase XerD [Ralstonia insidiosa]MBA9869742.1 site-specific integrase [Ralstonia insidiosa]MBA9885025.1 site-specific integrase [Ralstonia pickettii]MBA9894753.1 site-specific integrase [Ralstonia pickettii]
MSDQTLNWDSASTAAFEQWQSELCNANGKALSDQTRKQRLAMYGKFLKFLYAREVPLSVLTVGSAEIELFLASLTNSAGTGEPNRSTSQRYVRLISDVIDQLVSLGLRDSNPSSELLKQFSERGADRSADKLPECLDAEQDANLRRHILQMPTDTWTACRNRAMLALFAGAGLTLYEGIHMRLQDVHLAKGEKKRLVTPATPSGSRKVHDVPLAEWCVEPLADWIKCLHLRGDDWTFLFPSSTGGLNPDPIDEPLAENSVYSLISTALVAVGYAGADKGAAILRNTFALRNLVANTSQNDLRSWMGLETDYQLFRIARRRGLWATEDRRPV